MYERVGRGIKETAPDEVLDVLRGVPGESSSSSGGVGESYSWNVPSMVKAGTSRGMVAVSPVTMKALDPPKSGRRVRPSAMKDCLEIAFPFPCRSKSATRREASGAA